MSKEIQNMFSLEGPDGAGKTTQLPLIKYSLESCGYPVKILKSPDITPLGEFIRNNVTHLEPWLRNQLFLLDINHTLRKIGEQEFPGVLLWDRYIDSFYTSNKEMTHQDAVELVRRLPRPVKTYLLDIEPEFIFSERKETLDEHSNADWLRQKVDRYHKLAELEPSRIIKIDARLPINQVTKLIVGDIVKNMETYNKNK